MNDIRKWHKNGKCPEIIARTLFKQIIESLELCEKDGTCHKSMHLQILPIDICFVLNVSFFFNVYFIFIFLFFYFFIFFEFFEITKKKKKKKR